MTSSAELQLYVIERLLPGAGQLGNDQLHEIASRSCTVLEELGPDIQWIHSYVTDDKVNSGHPRFAANFVQHDTTIYGCQATGARAIICA